MSRELELGIALRQTAESLIIHGQNDYNAAAEFLVNIKTKMKEVEAAMDPQCKSAYAAWQTANDQKKRYLAPYVEAESITKASLSSYQLEQRRIAEVAEAKAREEALKQEEAERKKLLARANRTKDEDRAEDLRQQADMVFVPVVAPDHSITKAEGVSTSDTFDVEITNTKEFLLWLIESGLDLSTVLSLKTGPIKQYIKLTKTTKIPGCRINKTVTISAKGRV